MGLKNEYNGAVVNILMLENRKIDILGRVYSTTQHNHLFNGVLWCEKAFLLRGFSLARLLSVFCVAEGPSTWRL